MKEFPKGGLIGKVMDAAKTVKQMHIPLHAAYAAYFIILAFFPALVLILSVLRYTGMEVRGLVELLGDILPSTMVGDAEELIYSTYRNSSGALVGVSAVTALWSASRGIYGMLTGLNAVYGVSENRGYIYTRSISVVYTFVFILILLLTLVLHVFGSSIINLMRQVDNPVVIFLHRPDRSAVFPAAVFTEPGLYTDVHGAAQQAQPFYGKPSRRRAVQSGLAGVFGHLLHLRGEFLQIFHDLRLGVRHCHHHAVAVLLYEHPVLRRGAEPVSDG